MKEFQSITFSLKNRHIAHITLNRPSLANAQNTEMLYELNEAMELAAQDDSVKVIMLDAKGKHFSSGHDLVDAQDPEVYNKMQKRQSSSSLGHYNAFGIEGHMAREEEIYLGFCERWRNIPKPTIAAVQGKCIAGGLMLILPCDLIIASEDALFCDPTVDFGVPGIEYFTLPFEIGGRKAKELLFTADTFSAQEALELGMINRVVPLESLREETMLLAQRIAKKSGFALKLAKQVINEIEDIQGRKQGMNIAFAKHQIAHAHYMNKFDLVLDPSNLPAVAAKNFLKKKNRHT